MSRELKRINVNMPEDLVTRIDEYADKMCINRTSAINILCSMSLDGFKTIDAMDEMMKMVKGAKVIGTDQ